MTNKGQVFWITGLSGSGKSTLAHILAARLRDRGETVVILDGDELRTVFGTFAETAHNHDREMRLMMAMRYGRLCRLMALQGITVVIATISLFKEIHAWNRVNLPCYFEIYLRVPIAELRCRDSKGIYSRFDKGVLCNVAGLDLDIDEPTAADFVVEFIRGETSVSIADRLLKFLENK
jgi:adenylylsulfate kinase-like enzyme